MRGRSSVVVAVLSALSDDAAGGCGEPTLSTVTLGRSRRVDWTSPVEAPPAAELSWPVTKMATSEPFWTLPATRSGSVRLTEMAVMPFGIGRELAVACTWLPNWLAMTC